MRVDCSNSVNHYWVQVMSYSKYSLLFLPVVGIEPATSRWFHSEAFSNETSYPLHHVSLPDNKDEVSSLNVLNEKNAKICSLERSIIVTKSLLKKWVNRWGLGYADYIPLHKKGGSCYDTRLHLVVSLQFRNSGECGVTSSLLLLSGLL